MTEFVILSAVEQLEHLLDKRAEALQGAEEQAEGLKSDLTLMLDFLRESARSRNLNHLTSQVREMAHDAKAIIDDACLVIESGELESVRLRLRLCHEIESIRSRFREASDRKIQSGVEEEEDVGRQHQVMAPSEGDANLIYIIKFLFKYYGTEKPWIISTLAMFHFHTLLHDQFIYLFYIFLKS